MGIVSCYPRSAAVRCAVVWRRGARDVFRDRAGGGSSGADRLRDAYG